MPPSTLSGINRLPPSDRREIYARIIPQQLLDRFQLDRQTLKDGQHHDLLRLNDPPGSSSVEMALYHQASFPDPVFYGHITDTVNEQIHVLLYVLNDPSSPRYDVDRMPDGSPTKFGVLRRNIEAELDAMQTGLAPGQVRRGLRMFAPAIQQFEKFVSDLGHDMFFAEPLYYHNAVIFEKYGFAYAKGRKLMERIQAGFSPGGELLGRLDDSNPFRTPAAAESIRLRSWAIHDGLLGEPFTEVTVYKRVGRSAELSTANQTPW